MILRHRIITALVVAVVALAGCGSGADQQPLQISGGKADFGGFDFRLGTIGKGAEVELELTAGGAFKIELTQPDVASSKQATARLRIDAGTNSEETASSKTPSIEWTPASGGVATYKLTVINRSTTKLLKARLVGRAIVAFAPPSVRRTFCKDFSFDSSSKIVVAFFDADATLRIPKNGGFTPDGPDDVLVIPGAKKAVREATERGELVAIVSNQGGVHYGSITLEMAQAALAKTAALVSVDGGRVHYFDLAEEYNDDRKPKTGMADRLEQKLNAMGLEIDWNKSYMVGDAGWKKDEDTEPDGTAGTDFSNSDRKFAEALSIDYHHPRDYYGWVDYDIRRFETPSEVAQFNADHPDFEQ